MKPNRGEGMSAPELQPAALPEVNEPSGDIKSEQSPVTPENSTSRQSAPVISQAPVQLPSNLSAPVIPSDEGEQPSTTAHPSTAKNSDRIDKHWVSSAKSIINQTKDDPYKQKNEMSKFKADYIKQTFNKVVKADKEAA